MDIRELEQQADKALNYLASTDYEHAELRAKQNLLAELRKAIIAAGFDKVKEGAAEAKKQAAHNTPEFHDHLNLIHENDLAFFHIDNKRKRAVATIDLFRTMSANQRKG